MPGHLLGVLEPSVVLQINRDTGSPPGVTSDGSEKTRSSGPLADSSPGVIPVKSPSGHGCSKRINALKQRLPALEACGDNVLVEYLLQASDAQASRAPCCLFRGVSAAGARHYDR